MMETFVFKKSVHTCIITQYRSLRNTFLLLQQNHFPNNLHRKYFVILWFKKSVQEPNVCILNRKKKSFLMLVSRKMFYDRIKPNHLILSYCQVINWHRCSSAIHTLGGGIQSRHVGSALCACSASCSFIAHWVFLIWQDTLSLLPTVLSTSPQYLL